MKRKKKKGITVTVVHPGWWTGLRSGMKRARRQAANIFTVIGFVTVLILALRLFGGG